MSIQATIDRGLEVLAAAPARSTTVAAGGVVAAMALAAGLFLHSRARGPVFCPCPNCSPRSVSWLPNPMAPAEADMLIRTYGDGGQSVALDRHAYHLPWDPAAADRTQMTLADVGLDTDRRRFVDRLYADLVRTNPELARIPTSDDARARHWIALGALSGLSPHAIEDFVRGNSYGLEPALPLGACIE